MSWTWRAFGLAVWLAGVTAAALLAGAPWTGLNSSEQNADDRDTRVGDRAERSETRVEAGASRASQR
jgi:hypothetical protein